MLLSILQAMYLAMPAAISNIMPALATRFFPKILNIPLDYNRSFNGKRILGNNKTLRGLIFGILAGELVFLGQQILMHTVFIQKLSILSYSHLPWYFGFLFGVGALGGDLVKSFFKRQLGIPSGNMWFPFDQLDWVIGTLAILLPFVSIPLSIIIVGLILGLVLHVVVKFVGYCVGIDKKPI